MKINKFLKPQIIINVQYIIITILFLIYNNTEIINNKNEIIIYIYMPYIIYIMFFLILKMALLNHKIDVKNKIVFKTNFTYEIIKLIIFMTIIINFISIIEMIHSVGLVNLINKYSILYFQRYPGKMLSVSIALMNIIPICVLIYYDYISKIENKKIRLNKSFLIYVYILETLIICTASGIRFLFIANSVPLLINIMYHKKLNFILVKRIILFAIIIGTIVIGGQSIKTQNLSIKENISAITEYYTESINNVFYIIDNHYEKINPNYWTIYRTFKGVPFINFNKIDRWYIEKYGYIPITDRDDDFEYVKRMGIEPKNNTFSIWGYSYLDYGQYGWIFVAFQLVLIQVLYTISLRSKKLEIFYCLLILFVIEQIRTNGIINSRVINAAILFTLLYIIDNLISRYIKRKVNSI